MKRKKKGEYGYRNDHHKIETGKFVFGVAAILIQLAVRKFTNQEAMKNILTVMAIVSALPTANVAAPLLASIKYRTPSADFYRQLSAYEPQYHVLYDLILTSKEQIMPMDGVIIHPTGVYCYCSNSKLSTAKAETFINDLFRSHRLDPHVKILTDEKAFFKRASSLKPEKDYEDDGSVGYTVQLLKDISM